MKELYLHEAWDVLDAMKRLVDEDRARARTLLESYPQVVEALVQIQRRLGMIPTVSGVPSGMSGERHNVEQSSNAALSSSAMASGSSQGSSGGISGNDPIQQAIQMARAQVTDFPPITIVSRSLASLFSDVPFSSIIEWLGLTTQAEARLGGAMGRPPVTQPPTQSQSQSSQSSRGMGGGLPQLPPEIEEIMQVSHSSPCAFLSYLCPYITVCALLLVVGRADHEHGPRPKTSRAGDSGGGLRLTGTADATTTSLSTRWFRQSRIQ